MMQTGILYISLTRFLYNPPFDRPFMSLSAMMASLKRKMASTTAISHGMCGILMVPEDFLAISIFSSARYPVTLMIMMIPAVNSRFRLFFRQTRSIIAIVSTVRNSSSPIPASRHRMVTAA